MKYIVIPLLICACAQISFAGGSQYNDKKPDPTPAPAPTPAPVAELKKAPAAPTPRQIMAEFFNSATDKLVEIKTALNTQQNEMALKLSKTLLDEVREKSGFDAKTVRRQKIKLAQALTSGENGVYIDFRSLSLDVQNTMITALDGQREGYYLDMLNLMKRANLLYIQALAASLSNNGNIPLDEDDQKKIVRDVSFLVEIPIYFYDEQTNIYILTFDSEIGQNDQSYLFNRELKSFLKTNKFFLNISSEKLVADIIQENKKTEIEKFIAATKNLPVTVPKPEISYSADSEPFREFEHGVMATAEYKHCTALLTKDGYYMLSKSEMRFCIHNTVEYKIFDSCINQITKNRYYSVSESDIKTCRTKK